MEYTDIHYSSYVLFLQDPDIMRPAVCQVVNTSEHV